MGALTTKPMKIIRTQIIIVAIGLAIGGISAKTLSARTPQTDPSVQTFWTRFQSAVIKGDKETVSSLVQFPIGMPYGFRTIKTKAELLKRYRELFNLQADAAKCFAQASPEVSAKAKNQFKVGCKDAAGNETVEYGFVKTRGIWKLKSLDNLNE